MSLRSGAPVLEGPVETYTVEELEQKVIKRLQVQKMWRNPTPSTFLSRQLRVQPSSRGRFHLLPGGRWLLDNINGYVYVLDLDKPDSRPHLLFEDKIHSYFGRLEDPLSGSAIWIDSSKPWLSLRIALHNDDTAERLGEFRRQDSSTLSDSLFLLVRFESDMYLSVGLYESRCQSQLDRGANRYPAMSWSLRKISTANRKRLCC